MVLLGGLEPPRVASADFKSGVSTISTTVVYLFIGGDGGTRTHNVRVKV